MANVPGFETVATGLMKQTFKNKGVASIEELRDMAIELDVRMIGCQMTMDVFGFKREDFIPQARSAARRPSLNMPRMPMCSCSSRDRETWQNYHSKPTTHRAYP
jgi:hypothetical protein